MSGHVLPHHFLLRYRRHQNASVQGYEDRRNHLGQQEAPNRAPAWQGAKALICWSADGGHMAGMAAACSVGPESQATSAYLLEENSSLFKGF